MNRQELTAIYNALNALLGLSDNMLEQVAKWISPAPPGPGARGNGHDPDPPPAAPRSGDSTGSRSLPVLAKRPPMAKAARRAKPANARTAEHKLLTVMATQGGLTVVALANLVDASRSATGERLRRLSDAGKVEKDHAGRWRLAGEKARSAAGDGPGPTSPSPS